MNDVRARRVEVRVIALWQAHDLLRLLFDGDVAFIG